MAHLSCPLRRCPPSAVPDGESRGPTRTAGQPDKLRVMTMTMRRRGRPQPWTGRTPGTGWRALRWLPLLLLVPLLGACHQWIVIQPTELPKLNGSNLITAGDLSATSRTGDAEELTVPRVLTPAGRLVEIDGGFNARVVAVGPPKVFNRPVVAEVDGSDLLIRGEHQRFSTYSLRDVRSVAVSQPDPAKTAALIVGIVLAAAAVVFVTASFVGSAAD
jgi:hypothetical protein